MYEVSGELSVILMTLW